MSAPPVREFVLRAAGVDRSVQNFVLGKFPLGPPELKTPGTSWQKHEKDCYTAKPDRFSTKDPESHKGGKQWILNDTSKVALQPLLVGQPEAGMGDGSSGAGYFLLIRHRGSEDFLTMPVTEWQNFKPVVQRSTNSLEDAEAEMKRKRLAAERVNPRLAQAAKATAGEAGPTVPGDEDDNDSDAEWKDIRARAASRQAAAKAAPRQRRPTGGEGEDDEREEEEDHAERSDKGEDWEHSDEAADDDLDMGEGEEEGAEASPIGRRHSPSGSSDEDDNVAPSKVSRRLKRMMRQTGLEDSEDDEESGGEEESESIEDEEDLDKMATGLLGREKSPSPGAKEAASKKRKAPTPPPQQAQPAAAPPPVQAAAAAKRPRTAAEPAAAAAAEAAAAPAAAPASAVSEDDVRALLQSHGRLPLNRIAQHFKSRLRTAEDKNAFTKLVRRIAKLDPAPSADGQKYLVLR